MACGIDLDLGAYPRTESDGGAADVDGGGSADAGIGGEEKDVSVASVPRACGRDSNRRCIVFVTRASVMGDIGDLSQADILCNVAAESAGLDGTFHAYLSDGTVDPPDRIAGDGPWGLVNGPVIFATHNDLRVEGARALNRDEFGAPLETDGFWTGAKNAGSADTVHCEKWTSKSSTAHGSFGTGRGERWIKQAEAPCGPATGHLLCFEG